MTNIYRPDRIVALIQFRRVAFYELSFQFLSGTDSPKVGHSRARANKFNPQDDHHKKGLQILENGYAPPITQLPVFSLSTFTVTEQTLLTPIASLAPVLGMIGYSLFGVPLHEHGHALAVKTLFKDAKPHIEYVYYEIRGWKIGYAGGMTMYHPYWPNKLSKFGAAITGNSTTNARGLIAATGPAVDIIQGIGLESFALSKT